MKYYTKHWYNLMQSNLIELLDEIKIIEDKDYSEEELKKICKDEYDRRLKEYIKEAEESYNAPPISFIELMGDDFDYKDMIVVDEETGEIIKPKSKEEAINIDKLHYYQDLEEFNNRLEFDKKDIKKVFDDFYNIMLKESKELFPDFISNNVDSRLLALNIMPKKMYQKFAKHEEEIYKEIENVEKEADKDLIKQDIPEDILNMFLELHDGRIIKIEEQNSDCIITIISEEDKKIILKFEDNEFIENELEDNLKQNKEENDVWWLCHELYKVDNKYELHILLDTNNGLKYLTIRCKDIKIV